MADVRDRVVCHFLCPSNQAHEDPVLSDLEEEAHDESPGGGSKKKKSGGSDDQTAVIVGVVVAAAVLLLAGVAGMMRLKKPEPPQNIGTPGSPYKPAHEQMA